ncbi:MAG: putative bifunctional diguanylate cyclase/phosphodiesterase [Bdellovibrionales bacterium]
MMDFTSLTGLLTASGDIAYDWDLIADHIDWFGASGRLFGDVPPAHSADFYNVIHDDDRHLVFGTEAATIDREYRLRRAADGQVVWVHERGTAEFRGGSLLRQRGLLRIIEKQQVMPSSEWQTRDELTNCLNRNDMQLRIGKAIDTSRVTKRGCVYLVLGIDKMSFVNEAVGMAAGDGLLRGVAQRLAEMLPSRAILGRVGGDMFGILLTETAARDFLILTERLLQSFRHQPVVTPVVPLHITISIGGVRLPDVAHSASEAMIFAEQALHDAHQRGRNLFIEYIDSPERMQENRQMLEVGERVKRAFKNKSLKLAFQPIVDGQTLEPLFYEALVRMFGDDGQLISAAQFVPVVEQLGLALELDRCVLDLAVAELEAAPDLCLSINVSGLTAAQADWPDHVRKVLGSRRSVAERLIVEITETAAIVDVSETRRFVDSLRALGGRVALDDFGAGFTSVRHLRSLALSIMKIDRDLLHDVTKNAEQQHLVRMLIEIARGLGLKTVAEGVENAETAAWLQNEKVDMMQGYYFGKPALERSWISGTGGDTRPKMHIPRATAEAGGPAAIRIASSQ